MCLGRMAKGEVFDHPTTVGPFSELATCEAILEKSPTVGLFSELATCEAISEKSPTVGLFSELATCEAILEKSPTVSSPNWLCATRFWRNRRQPFLRTG